MKKIKGARGATVNMRGCSGKEGDIKRNDSPEGGLYGGCWRQGDRAGEGTRDDTKRFINRQECSTIKARKK